MEALPAATEALSTFFTVAGLEAEVNATEARAVAGSLILERISAFFASGLMSSRTVS